MSAAKSLSFYRSFLVLLVALLFGLPVAAYEADGPSRAAAERLLEVAGGRDAWRKVHGIKILAVNHFPQFELPAWFEFDIDFRSPYIRTRMFGENLNRLRVFENGQGWSLKQENGEPELKTLDAESVAPDQIRWDGAFSRAMYRMAINDPTLRVVLVGKDRMEVSNVSGEVLAWYKLGENGYPVSFGLKDEAESEGLTFEKVTRFGPYLLPANGSSPGGSHFETIIARVQTSPMQHESKPPARLDSISISTQK